jgi:hypothetical protein
VTSGALESFVCLSHHKFFIAISRRPSHPLESGWAFLHKRAYNLTATRRLAFHLVHAFCIPIQSHSRLGQIEDFIRTAPHSVRSLVAPGSLFEFSVQLHEAILFAVSCLLEPNISLLHNEPGARAIRIPAGFSRDTRYIGQDIMYPASHQASAPMNNGLVGGMMDPSGTINPATLNPAGVHFISNNSFHPLHS